MGLSVGTLMLPPSPSWFRRMIKDQKKALNHRRIKKDNDTSSFTQAIPLSSSRRTEKILTELCAYALSWSILCGIVQRMELGIGMDNKEPLGKGFGKSVSRRMVSAHCLRLTTVCSNVICYRLIYPIYFGWQRSTLGSCSDILLSILFFIRPPSIQRHESFPARATRGQKNLYQVFISIRMTNKRRLPLHRCWTPSTRMG